MIAAIPSAMVSYPAYDPKGVVMEIHPGGWSDDYAHQLEAHQKAERWVKRGYVLVTIRYAPGRASLTDVVDQYDRLRAGTRAKIIVTGQSAGGQLALMLAHERPLDRVIADAAPTDLTAGDLPPSTVYLATNAFGVDRGLYSPALRSLRTVPSSILLTYSDSDPSVPSSQALLYKHIFPGVKLYRVRPGKALEYVHTRTSRVGMAARYARELLHVR